MNNITVVFCEGQHDIAFLSKILMVHDYKSYDKKLNKFKEPFGRQFISILDDSNISDKKLGFHSEYQVPSVSLHKDNDELVLFHNMGGDDRIIERNKVLSMYKSLQGEEDDFTPNIFNYKFLYFFDADDKPVEDRMLKLNTELSLSSSVQHSHVNTIDSYTWGCYVFHKDLLGGYLEDILLDLMIPNNEQIFENSKNFIDNTDIDIRRQREYICYKDEHKPRNKFKKNKSIISIAGQLQFSSMNNSVIIANSDYIKKDDILNNTHCQNIIKLFQNT